MTELGYQAHDNVIIATETTAPGGDAFYGFYSTDTGQAYINDIENESTRDLLTTAGHEAMHAMDDQAGLNVNDPDTRDDNNLLATNFGTNLADYADFSLDYHGYDGLAMSNDHVGNDSDLVSLNNTEFSGLDLEQGDFRLTNQQQENRATELDDCTNIFCAGYVENKYLFVSSVQGVAEATGVATSAVDQVIEDLQTLVQVANEILEDPTKAERAAEHVHSALMRANEIVEGDNLTENEKKQFVAAVNQVASELIETGIDAENLDGPGIAASFGEGEKYGAYAASLIPLARFSKYLRGISRASGSSNVDSTPSTQHFDIDSEAAGISHYDRFRDDSGKWDWPHNDGFEIGTVRQETIPVGTRVDRYGSVQGSFLAPEGTPLGQRSLAPGSAAGEYSIYEIIKPLPVESGKTAPWFDQAGGGTQYRAIDPDSGSRVSIQWLINNGYVRTVE